MQKANAYGYIFDSLKKECTERTNYEEFHERLCVKTNDDEDLVIESASCFDNYYKVTRELAGGIFSVSEKSFFCTIGNFGDVDPFPTLLEPVDSYDGFWVSVISGFKVLPLRGFDDEYYELYNNVLAFNEDVEPRKVLSIDLSDIKNFFPEVKVYLVLDEVPHKNFDAKNYLARLIGISIARNGANPIEFEDETIKEYELTFLDNNINIPFHLVLYSYLASHYKHCFLELYRCIEKLYPVAALKKLQESVGLQTLCSFELAGIIEDTISWRPNEESSLELLLSEADSRVISEFRKTQSEVGGQYKDSKTSKFIYRIRNSNVHFRSALEELDFNDEQWNTLLRSMLKLIADLYDSNPSTEIN